VVGANYQLVKERLKMPVPKPQKGESEDEFMERCMHEVSKNSDRSNEQNVAICKQTWRDSKKEEKADSKFTCSPILKPMNEFKTLAEARGAYQALAEKLAETEQKAAKTAELEAQLTEMKAFGATSATENENFQLLIVEKDSEIAALKGENTALSGQISGLKSELETLQKSQKTAKIHARELVAASGGAPIAVDQAEINRMQIGDEKELTAAMLKTTDQAELNRMYREYNKNFRPNGKQKKD
jgi:hypothetical protein